MFWQLGLLDMIATGEVRKKMTEQAVIIIVQKKY